MWSSFAAAFRGISRAWVTQKHFRFDVCFGALVLGAGVWLGLSRVEWIVLVSAVTAVLALELVNTTVEFLCDLLQPRLHSSVALIKDVAAAAVFVGAMGAALLGLMVFLPRLAQGLLHLFT